MHPSLPLTAFEEYMLRDDRPAHPMDFFIRLRFTGRLDRSAVAAAWHRALMRRGAEGLFLLGRVGLGHIDPYCELPTFETAPDCSEECSAPVGLPVR